MSAILTSLFSFYLIDTLLFLRWLGGVGRRRCAPWMNRACGEIRRRASKAGVRKDVQN